MRIHMMLLTTVRHGNWWELRNYPLFFGILAGILLLAFLVAWLVCLWKKRSGRTKEEDETEE